MSMTMKSWSQTSPAQESRWAVATLDVSPVERALPKDSQYIPSYFRDWQVPVDVLLERHIDDLNG